MPLIDLISYLTDSYKLITFALIFRFMRRLFIFFLVVTVFASCSEYQKVLKSEELEPKLVMIDTLIARGKYKKTLSLFEQVVPQIRGTDRAAQISFQYATIKYELGDYLTSAYQFERFVESHPRSEKREEALFKAAKSHYLMSPVFSLDQEDTYKALAQLQTYIDFYPDGKFLEEANQLTAQLRQKLDLKAYDIAKGYHHREFYPQAIEAFTNFLQEHPGSEYRDDAQYYMAESQYLYAINSIYDKIKPRLAEAKVFALGLIEKFPESEHLEKANKLLEDIEAAKQINYTSQAEG
jgi:outer membrane protein assembly factor BamD